MTNRLPVNKELALDLGYERGFHIAGAGESFNAGHLGFAWQPVEDFRTTGRYEMRDRGGVGSVLTLGAAGRLGDNVTSLGRFQLSRTDFQGRKGSAMAATGALAWRPLHRDSMGLLFSYTRRDLSQENGAGQGETRDRSDTLSTDGFYQASRNVELYGRFALKFGDTSSVGFGARLDAHIHDAGSRRLPSGSLRGRGGRGALAGAARVGDGARFVRLRAGLLGACPTCGSAAATTGRARRSRAASA